MDLKMKRHQMRSLRQTGVPLPASAPCRDAMRRSPGWLKLNSVLLLWVAWNMTQLAAQKGPAPEVVTTTTGDCLIVPHALLDAIEAQVPAYHFPDGEERKSGYWGTMAMKKRGAFPFITWGDFNGDGYLDVVAILLGSRDWNVVIFHGQVGGTFVVVREHRGESSERDPTTMGVAKIPRGTDTEMGEFSFDVIELAELDASVSYVWFAGDRYEVATFGE